MIAGVHAPAIGLALALAANAPATGAPATAVEAELSRLAGHQVDVAPDRSRYRIVDVAGDGAPLVGVVHRDGDALYLITDAGPRYRLTGPLARPRIAGPRYKVWVIGTVDARGDLRARRLGILAPP